MRFLWIGDSITQGMQDSLAVLFRSKGISGRIYSRTGWSTASWLRQGRLETILATEHPDVVVLALGTNDGSYNAAAVSELDGLMRRMTKYTYWIGSFIDDAHNESLEVFAKGRAVSGVKLVQGLPRTPDGVHFPSEAYPELAGRCFSAILALRDKEGITTAGIVGLSIAGFLLYLGIRHFDPEKGKAKPTRIDWR